MAVEDITLNDVDFEKVSACKDKVVLKKYIKLLTDDGSYFHELLQCCKDRLLEVAPKEYYLLYPKVASDQEVQDSWNDLLEWESQVRETDQAIRGAAKDNIFDEKDKASAPIRGQEAVAARPNVQRDPDSNRRREVLNEPNGKNDKYARDKTSMRDYYREWDKVNVDELEEELDEGEKQAEDARRKHFAVLKEEQDEANAVGPVGGALPEGVPEAHRKHLADSEKEKGNEAFYAKDWEEAEAYYSRSIHFRSDDPSTWANRALVRLKLERAEDALVDCDKSLALNGRYMKALHRKGKALHELHRYEEAVQCFQLALAESPGNTQINGDLMVARRKLRSGTSAPPKQEFQPPNRRVSDAPSCVIEEVEEEAPAGAGFTRVVIEEASDSEDENELVMEEVATKATGSSATPAAKPPAAGFRKVAITEESDSEEEAAAAAPPAAGFRKVAIVEESDSDGEEPATAPAAAPAAAPAEEVCFDDMD
mmetsp:Transcript_46487/g.101495  ORF Transcript_46487/g.101495 Transcript_46487/m.101495 type:complete len:481 (+) Transcript_46487:84-1526(+)